jgi:hypothetical protein
MRHKVSHKAGTHLHAHSEGDVVSGQAKVGYVHKEFRIRQNTSAYVSIRMLTYADERRSGTCTKSLERIVQRE